MELADILRIERAERAALLDLHDAASPEISERLGLVATEIGGALVSLASAHPNILVNRIIGLGLGQPAKRQIVEEIVARYAEAGIGHYFLHVDPAARPVWLADWLERAGLRRYHRGWAKFVRGPEPAPVSRSDLEIRRIGPEHGQKHADAFGHIAATGFEVDQAWAPAIAGVVGRPGYHIYLSFDPGTGMPAGCGAMRIDDRVAWFDWAATLPEFRRRGSQSAIMAQRIQDALDAGCELMATSTGEAVTGDPQHSYRNIERAGFELTHVRDNWVPA